MKSQLKTPLLKLTKTGWTYGHKKLHKKFEFKDFNDAFSFMTRCALSIAELNHHPEWSNIYNKLSISLTTHDAGDISLKDIELAKIMNKIAASYSVKG